MKRPVQPQQQPADKETHQKTQNQVQLLFAYAVPRGGRDGVAWDRSLVRDHVLHMMPSGQKQVIKEILCDFSKKRPAVCQVCNVAVMQCLNYHQHYVHASFDQTRTNAPLTL